MKNILLLYGGRSYEHDVSVISAIQVGELWQQPDRLWPVYMRDGQWMMVQDWMHYTSYTADKIRAKPCRIEAGGVVVAHKYVHMACALLLTHGGEGEDGTLQALLQYYQIPYTSTDSFTSGLCMDKLWCKQTLAAQGFTVVDGGEAKVDDVPPLPCIVKPARLGSSIGVSVAHTEEEWRQAYYQALRYDTRVLWERYVPQVVEYNCAAVRDGRSLVLSEVERPVYAGETYSFAQKYKSSGTHELPALIEDALYQQIQSTTARLYEVLGLRGVVRVDYLWDGHTLYVNEINTIPGALAYRLFSAAGVPINKLVRILVDNARVEPYPKANYGELLGELVGTWK